MSLKQQTFSAIRWTTVAMLGKAMLQFGQTAVLARILAPSDFGLLSMIFAVMAFTQVFADLGVSNAIIHHQYISPNQLSSLYWLNVLVGQGLTLVLLFSSHSISVDIFKQPDLQPALAGMSLSILLLSLGQQVRVMAEKAMRFSIVAKIELTAALLGFTTALGWALYSPSIYALVAGSLTNSFAQTLLLWLFAANGWKPKLRLEFAEIREFLKFGSYMMANNLINSINSQIDILIAGRMFSAEALGFYSLPRNLSLTVAGVINPIITRVGLPVMAKAQNDKNFLKSVYLKTMRMTASINFPVYLALSFFSEEVVIVVFGQNWISSAPLLKFLAIWGMFRSCGNPVGSLLLAVGKANSSFKWNLTLLFIVPPSLLWASHFGVVEMALTQTALMIFLLLPIWYFLVRPNCGASAMEYLGTLFDPLMAATLAISAGYAAVYYIVDPVWRLATAFLVMVPVYTVASYVVNRTWLLALHQLVIKK